MELGLTPWRLREADAATLSAQAQLAEALGYGSFWLPENHFNDQALPDPLMLLAAVAAATTTIRLATTSYLLPLRNPLLAAEQVAVLDRLSNGRVLLGVGRGYSKETLRAFDIDPGSKREIFAWSLERLRRAWQGEAVSLHDDGSDAVMVEPRPCQQPHPPIWVAAFGPKALAQAGRLGLPYLASPIDTLAELEANYARFDAAAAEAGHAPVGTRPIMRTVLMSDDDAVLSQVRAQLSSMKLPRGLTTPPELDDWAILGGHNQVADKIAEYREALAPTHLVITHFRFEGLRESDLRASVEGVASLLLDKPD